MAITDYIYMCVERYTEIERENRILLEKMTHIMQNNGISNLNSSANGLPTQLPATSSTSATRQNLYTASAVLPSGQSLQQQSI